jgi:hypothetical protein
MNMNTCSRVMAVYIYYYQYKVYMYDLCMFIRYLVSITQVLKDTHFGLDNWCECGIYFIYLFISANIELQVYSVTCC